ENESPRPRRREGGRREWPPHRGDEAVASAGNLNRGVSRTLNDVSAAGQAGDGVLALDGLVLRRHRRAIELEVTRQRDLAIDEGLQDEVVERHGLAEDAGDAGGELGEARVALDHGGI